MEAISLRVLTGADVRRAVSMTDAIDAVRGAFIQLSDGEAVVPVRTAVPVEREDGVALFMPAYLPRAKALGAKVVSVFPGNLQRGLKTIHAVMLVLDAETGRPRALMDGTWLTALRTGAASGLATDLLARPESETVAIIGAGGQARAQLLGVTAVRPLRRVLVFDTSRETAETFVAEMAGTPASGNAEPEIEVAGSSADAVREADVICTATTSRSAVFEDADVRPGTHINAIGAYTPDMQEVPAETVARARVVVDSRDAALEEAGDLLKALAAGLADESVFASEIGAVADGRIPGRESPDEITLFKAVGVAVQDVAVGDLVLRRAEELGLGLEVEL